METRKNKVVFAALSAKYVHATLAPWCLASATNKYEPSFDVDVCEGTINEPETVILQKILSRQPFAVGISCYIWNIEKTLNLAKLIKQEAPQTIVILGGPEVSMHSEEVLRQNLFIDFICEGEGEENVPKLLAALWQNLQPTIDGVAYLKDEKFFCLPQKPLESQPPSPYTQKFFDALNGRIVYMETSRGCPYSCAFCLSGKCGKARWFSLEQAFSDILLLIKNGVKTIKFVDRTFNANIKHANQILNFILQNYGDKITAGTCFHFEIAGDILTEETFKILEKLPPAAVQLEIGLQSFNEKTLEAVNRKTNTQNLISNIKRLVNMQNMHIHIDLIAGLPFEDLPSFKQSFNTAYFLNANMLQLGFLKLLHGAAMREDTQKYPCVFNQIPPYEIISNPWLTMQDFDTIKKAEDSLERLYNSARFLNTLNYVLEKTNLTPFEIFENVPKAPLKTSLEEYTSIIFEHFKTLNGINEACLRDEMALDFLAFNKTGMLAKALQIKDPCLKLCVKALVKNPQTAPKSGTRRGVAILYSKNTVAYADYTIPNPITGRFNVTQINLDDISRQEKTDKLF